MHLLINTLKSWSNNMFLTHKNAHVDFSSEARSKIRSEHSSTSILYAYEQRKLDNVYHMIILTKILGF